jgi:hypothetical protein
MATAGVWTLHINGEHSSRQRPFARASATKASLIKGLVVAETRAHLWWAERPQLLMQTVPAGSGEAPRAWPPAIGFAEVLVVTAIAGD